MTRAIRELAGRIADRLLPQTEAAAGCAKDCWKECGRLSNQMWCTTCCIMEDCRTHC